MKRPKNETIGWGSVLAGFPEEALWIAQIIEEWNVVEFELAHLLSNMLAAPAPIVFPMIFAINNNRGRLDVIEPAVTRLAKTPEEKVEVTGLMLEARSVLNVRNGYTHAIYICSTTSKRKQLQAVNLKNFHKGKESRIPVKLGQLRKDLIRITKLADDIRFTWMGIALQRQQPKPTASGESSPPVSD